MRAGRNTGGSSAFFAFQSSNVADFSTSESETEGLARCAQQFLTQGKRKAPWSSLQVSQMLSVMSRPLHLLSN